MNKKERDRNLLTEAITEIIKEADECKASERDSFQAGRLLAYNEVLMILKTTVNGHEDLEQILDFDIDERYS